MGQRVQRAPEGISAQHAGPLPRHFTRGRVEQHHPRSERQGCVGLPALRVTHRDHPDDLANARFLQDRGAEILEAAGALRVTKAPVTPQTTSAHLLGTCRMGNDPATSVIDKYHRSHDVRNLFVCDGSSLVTSGRGQPTMTIQALAFRAGEHIARFAKRGEI